MNVLARAWVLAAAMLVFSGPLASQPVTSPVSVVPDCIIFFDRTASGSSAAYDNRFMSCDAWKVNYTSSGFTAVSVELQYAPDSSGSPGTWAAWAGTVIDGTNPSTATDHAQIVARGYYPWVRVSVTVAGSGRLRGSLYGYRTQAIVASMISSAASFPVQAAQGAAASAGGRWPVYLSDGTSPLGEAGNPLHVTGAFSVTDEPYCNLNLPVSVTASGMIQLVPASTGKAIHVCHISISAQTAPVDLRLVSGTGTNCASGATGITGFYYQADAIVLTFPDGALRLPVGTALCVDVSSATPLGGVVVYALK